MLRLLKSRGLLGKLAIGELSNAINRTTRVSIRSVADDARERQRGTRVSVRRCEINRDSPCRRSPPATAEQRCTIGRTGTRSRDHMIGISLKKEKKTVRRTHSRPPKERAPPTPPGCQRGKSRPVLRSPAGSARAILRVGGPINPTGTTRRTDRSREKRGEGEEGKETRREREREMQIDEQKDRQPPRGPRISAPRQQGRRRRHRASRRRK